MTSRTATAALLAVVLDSFGAAGDYLIQTDHDARTKGAADSRPVTCDQHPAGHGTRDGRAACLSHVASFTATQAAGLFAARRLTGLPVPPARLAAVLAVSAITHYAIDRREGLRRAAHATGKGQFYDLADHGINGAALMDQAVHKTVHVLTALAAAGRTHR
ncbi:hypothetical protein [Streptomyces violascens]|uniref:hypothetical protein n=1 Tax=Streptomyces violascens TaxID=67381 RepID=UPI00369241CC